MLFGPLPSLRRFFHSRDLWAAALGLALGIGAVTAVFAVFDHVLLRPLPVPDSQRLYLVQYTTTRGFPVLNTLADYRAWTQDLPLFEKLSAVTWALGELRVGDSSRPVERASVTSSFLGMMGASRAYKGRLFNRLDDQAGQAAVAVVSFDSYVADFNSKQQSIGQTIWIDEVPYVLIGVLPPDFKVPEVLYPQTTRVWTSVGTESESESREMRFQVLGLAKTGVSADQINKAVARSKPEFGIGVDPRGWRPNAIGLLDKATNNARPLLWVLLGSVVLVLLISSTNAATILATRNLARTSEFAIRAALGASRKALFALNMAQAVIVTLIGAALGLLFAWIMVRQLTRFAPANLPRISQTQIDWNILAFWGFMTLLVASMGTLLSSLRLRREDLLSLARGNTTTTNSKRHLDPREFLSILQIGLATVVVIGAGLTMESLWKLENEALGFDANNLISVTVELDGRDGPTNAQIEYFENLLGRLSSLRGIESASMVSRVPLGLAHGQTGYSLEGNPGFSRDDSVLLARLRIAPNYFATMRMPLLEGRDFLQHEPRPRTIILNQSLKSLLFQDGSAAGKEITFGGLRYFVAGVVGDSKQKSLDVDMGFTAYVPYRQNPLSRMDVVVRHSLGDRAAAVLKSQLEVNSGVSFAIRPMSDLIALGLAKYRFSALALVLLGFVAASIAITGSYGLIAHHISRRRREIGIRMAMGAGPRRILLRYLGFASSLAVPGLIVGVALATATSNFLASLLYKVSFLDWTTFLLASTLILIAALAASLIPVARILKEHPWRAIAVR